MNTTLKQLIEYLYTTGQMLNQIRYDKEDNSEINEVYFNSEEVKPGGVFVCIKGEHVDGHDYAESAVKNGAVAVIATKEFSLSVPVLEVQNTELALAQAAAFLYKFPGKKINITGVTGTNGKTTVTHFIENIFETSGKKCGLIGTMGSRYSSSEIYEEGKHTTPQANDLQKTLRDFLDKGITNVVMEVSSHSIEQHRTAECNFKGAVHTNLTQDHLDYHITMENYFLAKSKLFSSLKNSPENYAVINKDDSYRERFIKAVPGNVKIFTYGIKNDADIIAEDIKFTAEGSTFNCVTSFGTGKITLQTAGIFGIYNALAALSTGLAEGIDFETCAEALETTPSVAGRFETVMKQPLVIVDYAHTPDGLKNVLVAAREITPADGELICVFGCGGDRDATKRPKMGRIAETLCDKIIITSDNPRTEDTQQIITDILAGIQSLNSDKMIVEIDRRVAIENAARIAKENDVVVLAGKGHETYQILGNETVHFDDKEEALKAFEKVSKRI